MGLSQVQRRADLDQPLQQSDTSPAGGVDHDQSPQRTGDIILVGVERVRPRADRGRRLWIRLPQLRHQISWSDLKIRYEALLGRIALLPEVVFEAQFISHIQHVLVFFRGERASQLREAAQDR